MYNSVFLTNCFDQEKSLKYFSWPTFESSLALLSTLVNATVWMLMTKKIKQGLKVELTNSLAYTQPQVPSQIKTYFDKSNFFSIAVLNMVERTLQKLILLST